MIKEGKVNKGGRNKKPTCARPKKFPRGQGARGGGFCGPEFIIERLNFPLLGHKQVTTITRIYPHIKSEVPVSIQFGSQDYPDSSIRWKPAVTFNPSTDRKVDLRTTGELHAWRISAIGKGTISMSGMTIEFVKAGLR